MNNEAQFKHIEDKMRQSIEANEPAFEEAGWAKMEALLDKEKRKPKPIIWLWLLLPVLLAGGSYWYYTTSKLTNSAPIAMVQGLKDTQQATASKHPGQPKPVMSLHPLPVSVQEPANPIAPQQPVSAAKSGMIRGKGKLQLQLTAGATGDAPTGHTEHSFTNIPISVQSKTTMSTSAPVPAESTSKVQSFTAVGKQSAVKPEDNNQAAVKKNYTTSVDSLVMKTNKLPAVATGTDSKKQSASKSKPPALKGFYLLANVGGDIGSVKLFSYGNSTATVKYGGGFGYRFNSKLSLQTGFYAGLKKYTAGPGDYHIKSGSYLSGVDISKVDAACMVYEIPLALRFDFLQKKSLTYYASVGLSSYIMKKEAYNYYYTWYNMPVEKYYSFTGNKQLFSNLSIAAGMEKKLSTSWSLLLEPSVAIPVSGVGDGKVKLFSTALMLGLKYTIPQK